MKTRLSTLATVASFLLALASCPGRCFATPSVPHCGHCHGRGDGATPGNAGGCTLLRTVESRTPALDAVAPAMGLAALATVPTEAGVHVRLVDPPRAHRHEPPERLWLRTHALLV